MSDPAATDSSHQNHPLWMGPAIKTKTLGSVFLCCAVLFGTPLPGQVTLPGQGTPPDMQSMQQEIAALKAQLAEQQKRIDALTSSVEDVRSRADRNDAPAARDQAAKDIFPSPLHQALGEVASTTPIIPPIAPLATRVIVAGQKTSGSGNPCDSASDANSVPLYLRLGSVCIVPIGFMDATFVWRDKNAASGIGSNFGSIPYNNVVNGKLSEDRFSIQNSRLGLRVDGDWKGTHFIGYNEIDFLGTSGSNATTVTNGAVFHACACIG
jgi:hypothetical protein